ncbi:MAG: hypothetical protein CMH85_01230 [Novosphingobium sp.]|nr:hypothetical protein [Novosphingobium sp.]
MTPQPTKSDILADLEAALTNIVADLREERETRGCTPTFCAGVAQLAGLVSRMTSMKEAFREWDPGLTGSQPLPGGEGD